MKVRGMESRPSTEQKARQINLDSKVFGTFAEIGAGQEVARWFFQAGHGSGTVAKSISAYDMAISDGLYGAISHYVSRERLEAMLDREYDQLLDRLSAKRGDSTQFFVYADTVATRSYSKHRQGHGWMGVRFQGEPRQGPSEIIIHAELLDPEPIREQNALGIVGVNLIFGAFYLHSDPAQLITSLLDELNRHRIEIDMIRFSGPAFASVDNRLMSLQLVQQGLTDAAMFTAEGKVVQPSEVLYGKPVIMERGSFRPITKVTFDMLGAVEKQRESGGEEPVVCVEITLSNLSGAETVDHSDFLARVEILGALGLMVMISNYTRFDMVTRYLREYTKNGIALILGVPTLKGVFEDKHYADLEGGLLEGLARLFSGDARLYVLPTKESAGAALDTADTMVVDPSLRNLYAYFRENGRIEPIQEFDQTQLHVTPAEVLAMLQSGQPGWEELVPAPAAELIKQRGFFGYKPPK
jgi:hypothetical protein